MNPAAEPPPSPTRHVGWKVWQNPIFRRYCRSRLRPRDLAIWILITVLIAGFLLALCRTIGIHQAKMAVSDAERVAIPALLVFQALILFVLGTAQVSGGMVAEKDEGVIDYQRLIPMTPLAKSLGYLFGLPVREYVLFAATLPFSAWALWRGGVEASVWVPLYGILLSSAVTYHLTGLVTGTVVKNKRWAFLVSIFLVFCLYTVVPQMAKFGLVFFKYLSALPVVEETSIGFLPRPAGVVLETSRLLAPTAKFFNLALPEAAFTLFCQAGLGSVFLIMLCRRWRRGESLLLGKPAALGFFVWIQIFLLGNALPLIEPGTLFPSRGWTRQLRLVNWQPQSWEALAMTALYGLATLMILFVMIRIITPSAEIQVRGWRRARKNGSNALPVLSDASSAFGWTLLMAVAGAAGWFLFTKYLVESRWFPGHDVPPALLGYFIAVMVSASLALQCLLEAKGDRTVGFAVVLVGFVPLMVGVVLGSANSRLLPAASWLIGISPVSGPPYAVLTLLPLAELPANLARSVPRAFYFWQGVQLLVALWLTGHLRAARKRIAGAAAARDPRIDAGSDR